MADHGPHDSLKQASDDFAPGKTAPSPPRTFACPHCPRKFYNPQALGGHQNAHKREQSSARKISTAERPVQLQKEPSAGPEAPIRVEPLQTLQSSGAPPFAHGGGTSTPESLSPVGDSADPIMETMDASIPDMKLVEVRRTEVNDADMEDFRQRVDEVHTKVDTLEQRLNEVEKFYSAISKKQLSSSKGTSVHKDKEKHIAYFKKREQDASCKATAAAKRMQELMRQFGNILSQLTQHSWAEPFMQPVDVAGLGLHDYFEVIEKPMDFSTIKTKMDANDGSGYKSVREICADVRLVFKNAMKYNDERDDVHVMAKTLLAKFEEKWLQLLPKVDIEEKRRKEEEAEAQLDMQLAQEASHAKMATELSNELDEVDQYLEELREMVLHKCRKMSTEEKRSLSTALTRLSPEDLSKALLIVAQNNLSFQATAEEVDLDIDAQSEFTLWRLKFFVKEALQIQGTSAASMGDDDTNNNNKRKREICDAFAKPSQKRSKKLP